MSQVKIVLPPSGTQLTVEGAVALGLTICPDNFSRLLDTVTGEKWEYPIVDSDSPVISIALDQPIANPFEQKYEILSVIHNLIEQAVRLEAEFARTESRYFIYNDTMLSTKTSVILRDGRRLVAKLSIVNSEDQIKL